MNRDDLMVLIGSVLALIALVIILWAEQHS